VTMAVLIVGEVVLTVGLKEVRVVVDGLETNAKVLKSWVKATRTRKVRFIIFLYRSECASEYIER